MNLILYDLSLNKIGDLITNGDTTAKHIEESVSYGEIDSISFEIRQNCYYFSDVINGNMLLYNDQFYIISEITSIDSSDKSQVYKVVASHNSKQLKDRLIADGEELDPMTIEQILTFFLYNTGVPIYNWEVGTVVADLTKYRTYTIKEMSIFEALLEIAELYNCYVFFDSSTGGNFINLYDKDTYRSEEAPLTLFESINIKEISITRNSDEFTTRLYAFGGTNPLTNLDVDLLDATVGGNPWGKTYVEDYSYYLDLGYTQTYIDNNPDLFLKEAIWRDSNYVDPDTLYADALIKLGQISTPKIDVKLSSLMKNVDGTLMDISQYPKLGYKVNVVDTRLQEEITFTVIGYNINYDTPWEIGLSITNVVVRKNALLDIVRSTQTMRRITKADGTVKPIYVDADITEDLSVYDLAVQQLNELAINATGFYQTVYTDPGTGAKTDYMHDNPVLSLSTVIYMRNSSGFFWTDTGWNGGNPTWTSGYTASGNIVAKTLTVVGINADWITTGSITSDNYSYTSGYYSDSGTQINLNDGSIKSKSFAITSSGSGYFSGRIKADSGIIGGWSLSETSIYSGDLYLNASGSISCNSDGSSYYFNVDNQGKLDAKGCQFYNINVGLGADFSGNVNFSSGTVKIGSPTYNCTIDSSGDISTNQTLRVGGTDSYLYVSSAGTLRVGGTDSYLQISSAGTISQYGSGTISFADGKFTINSLGAVTAKGASTFTSNLTCQSIFRVGDLIDYLTVSSLGNITTTGTFTCKGNTTLNGTTNTIANELKHTGNTLGFFNAIPKIKTTVLAPSAITTTGTADATYSSNEQTMLGNLKTDVTNLRSRLNEIWSALDGYGLI